MTFPWYQRDTKGHVVLANIVHQVERGIATPAALGLRCIPIQTKRPKRRDCTTLGKLFALHKPRGSTSGLKAIAPEHRYKGKIDWPSKREFIRARLAAGFSVRAIAKELGVHHSTLSKANARYGLYETEGSAKNADFYVEFTGVLEGGYTQALPSGVQQPVFHRLSLLSPSTSGSSRSISSAVS